MPIGPNEKFADAWTKAKRDFQTTTGVKKPAETLLWFRKGTGVESAFKKFDLVWKDGASSEANFKKLTAAYLAVEKQGDEYRKLLAKEVANAKAGKVPSGTTKDKYLKAVDKLENELYDIARAAKTRQAAAETAMNLMARAKAAAERGLKFAAEVERDPTPAKFNKDIQGVARHITQQIGNVSKVAAQGYSIGKDQPDNLFKVFAAWGNDGRRVPDNATREQVLREVGAFKQAVQGVLKWVDG